MAISIRFFCPAGLILMSLELSSGNIYLAAVNMSFLIWVNTLDISGGRIEVETYSENLFRSKILPPCHVDRRRRSLLSSTYLAGGFIKLHRQRINYLARRS
eukprot:scaffold2989_cov81-Skeletonema_menzelii.AAC.1